MREPPSAQADDRSSENTSPLGGSPFDARRSWWVLAPVLAPLAVFAKALAGRQLLAPGDGYHYFLPLHLLAARIWRSGEVPGWNPFSFSGSPLLALNQPGVFYPPNLVFLALPAALANNVAVVLSFVIAGAGAFALTRLLTHNDAGAAVAGLAFGLSGFMFGHIGHQSMIAAAAWLPWAFFGFELLRLRFSPLRLLGAGAALALMLIAGHPQMFLVTVLALGVHALVLTLADLRSDRGRPLGLLMLMVLTGVALAAIQLVPTAAILDATDRSALTYAQATAYSFPKTHLPLLGFPYLFGNNVPLAPFSAPYQGTGNLTDLSGYPGLAALCLAAAGLGLLRRDRRVLGLLAAAGVALVIASGPSTPLGRLVYALPLYGQVRGWGRFIVVVDLVIAVLAGCGVAALAQGTPVMRKAAARRAIVAAGLVLLAAVLVPLLSQVAQFIPDGSPRTLALVLPTGFALAAGGVCLLAVRSRRVWPALACMLVATDAIVSFGLFYEWRANVPSVPTMEAEISAARAPRWGEVPDAPGGIDRFVIDALGVDGISSTVNVNSAKGLPSANGYDPLAPRQYLETVGDMVFFGGITQTDDLWRQGSDLLDLLRVSVVLIPDGAPTPENSAVVGETPILAGGKRVPEQGLTRYDYRPRLPEAFLVGEVVPMEPNGIGDAVDGRVTFEPSSTTLVQGGCGPCGQMKTPGPAGTATLARPGTQSIDVTVQAARPALLVVSEGWFPGWRATVDGKPVPVIHANGLTLGVPVGPGDHDVRLRYQPPGLAAGSLISATTLALLMVTAWAQRQRRIRRDGAGDQVNVPPPDKDGQ